jgi:hypothetical protein
MKAPAFKPIAVLALAGLGTLFFTGCADDQDYAYRGRPAYYDGGPGPGYDDGGGVDFYYQGGVPYSREYGVLVVRDGGYYYRHGDRYEVYNRPARAHYRGGYAETRYRTDQSRDDRAKYDNHGREKYIKSDNHGRAKSPEGYQNRAVADRRYQQQNYQQARNRAAVQNHGGFQQRGGAHPQLTPQQQAELARKKKHPQQ